MKEHQNRKRFILKYRKHLITRDLSKNPLLRFRPTQKMRLDISLLDGRPEHDADGISQRGDATFLPFGDQPEHQIDTEFFQKLMKGKVEVDLSQFPGMVKRMTRIKQDAAIECKTSGAHSLFLGWPFVFVRRDGGRKHFAAPLMFFGVNLSFAQGDWLTIERIPELFSHNYMLKAWLEYDHKIGFDENALSSKEETPFSDSAESARIIKSFSDNLPKCHFGMSSKHENVFHLDPYASEVIPKEHKFSVMPFAVLGITKFPYKSSLDDLKLLAENAGMGKEMGLLNRFFGNQEAELDNGHFLPMDESEKYFIEESDSSQESAIAKMRHANIMLIDGPPGSGKSQTIVNLIAGALQRKESVALVCKKVTALHVVEKRLKHLKHLVQTVVDPSKQRRDVIDSIISVARDLAKHPAMVDENSRERLSQSISSNERYCDEVSKSMGNNLHYSVRGICRGISAK